MRTRIALLWWSGAGFALLAVSNGLLFLDKVPFAGIDLAGYRVVAGLLGVAVLVCGVLREAR